jgi:hypothetical protein
MSDLTFTRIEQSINDRKRLHLTFLKNVKTYTPFLELEAKAFADCALNRKTKKLMALSISTKYNYFNLFNLYHNIRTKADNWTDIN